ncbi:MAG: hypothetical protein D6681_11730 [Calditrichaeota bacterium]|nr:MAG: hypothetical protein D6681_11730 [Calditrichota bacterium]
MVRLLLIKDVKIKDVWTFDTNLVNLTVLRTGKLKFFINNILWFSISLQSTTLDDFFILYRFTPFWL